MDIKVSVVLDLLDTRKKIEIKKTEKNDEKQTKTEIGALMKERYIVTESNALMLIPRR